MNLSNATFTPVTRDETQLVRMLPVVAKEFETDPENEDTSPEVSNVIPLGPPIWQHGLDSFKKTG